MGLGNPTARSLPGNILIQHLPAMATLAVSYYLAALLGFALTLEPVPLAILWPPNAILLGALLMAQPGNWGALLLAVLPAHLAVQLNTGVPLPMALGWFITNAGEALLGALCVNYMLRQRLRFHSFRHVVIFLFSGVFLAPFISSFVDVSLVKFIGWGEGGYWELWQLRFFSNSVAILVIVPVMLTWDASLFSGFRKASLARRMEGAFLVLALFVVSIAVFISGGKPDPLTPLRLYAPLPLLLWAVVRFNSFHASLSFLLLAILSIWGTIQGHGPFVSGSSFVQVWSVQLFLIGVLVPLMLLSAAIQEMRDFQSSLSSKERKLNLALAAASIATWEWKIPRNMLARSASSAEGDAVEGKSPDTPLGAFFHLIHPLDREETLHTIERAAAQGSSFETEFRVKNPDGSVRHILSKGAAQFNEAGRPVNILGVNVDITERRHAENEARQKQEELTHLTRVVILGQLSGALAHELNQPLSSILTNAQVARRLLSRTPVAMDEIRGILDDIIAADKRAGEVIRHLRALFMKGEPKLQPLDVNQAILDALDLTHGDLVARKVTVVLQLGSEHCLVQADRVQLQQVLLNLIVNACEAMSGSQTGHRWLTVVSRFGDGNAQIVFSDTGPGIAIDKIDRVFDSFFTTKEHGLGFGLSISHAIIAKHGGSIEAMNNPEGGALFCITLPLHLSVHDGGLP